MTAPVKRYTVELYPGAPELHEVVLASEHDALHQQVEALRAEKSGLSERYEVLSIAFQEVDHELESSRGLLRELIGCVRTINRGPRHRIMVKGDDQPSYWQRQEWVMYLLGMCDDAEKALTATPAPEVRQEAQVMGRVHHAKMVDEP